LISSTAAATSISAPRLRVGGASINRTPPMARRKAEITASAMAVELNVPNSDDPFTKT